MAYRWHTGSVAWLIHRVSGVLLALYIFAHIYVLSSLRDPARFESLMQLMQTPLVKLAELGLLALVAAHTLNGIRVTLLEMGVPGRLQKPMFWGAFAVGFVVVTFGAFTFLGSPY